MPSAKSLLRIGGQIGERRRHWDRRPVRQRQFRPGHLSAL